MKIAFLSDIHSNKYALLAVYKDILCRGIKKIYCLGDVIGYGPDPLFCFSLAHTNFTATVKGNHENALVNPLEQNRMSSMAREGITYSEKSLTPHTNSLIAEWPEKIELPESDITLCHGTYTGERMWEYVLNREDAFRELEAVPTKLLIVGHTHSSFLFGNKKGLYNYVGKNLNLADKQKYVINVGSVGQPRDGDCRACYVTLDFNGDKIIFNIHRVFYNIQRTADAIRNVQLSSRLSERLFKGE